MVKKKDEIPEWVSDEIQNAKFKKPEELKRTGYILEIYEEGVKKKAHRLLKNGEVKELDALYRAQDCEKLHGYIMRIYQSEKSWEKLNRKKS